MVLFYRKVSKRKKQVESDRFTSHSPFRILIVLYGFETKGFFLGVRELVDRNRK